VKARFRIYTIEVQTECTSINTFKLPYEPYPVSQADITEDERVIRCLAASANSSFGIQDSLSAENQCPECRSVEASSKSVLVGPW
jgi:hypothetical protein